MLSKDKIDDAWREAQAEQLWNVCVVIRMLERERNEASADSYTWRLTADLNAGILCSYAGTLMSLAEQQRDLLRDTEPVSDPESRPERTE